MAQNTLRSVLAQSLIAAVLAVLSIAAHAAPAQIVLRMSSSLTADQNSSHYVWFERFARALKSNVGDKIVIKYYSNNQLGKEADVVQQVRLGSIDMMISGTSIWATAVPEMGLLDMGYLFKNQDHVGKSLDGPAGDALAKMLLEKGGVNVLGYAYSLGARNVYVKNPLTSKTDLQGAKIRVLPVPNFVKTLTYMGAVATPMAFGEIYTSLQTGVVEGLEQDAPTVLAGRFYEVSKQCYLTQHIFSAVIPVISKRAFDRIPVELRKEFLAAARDATMYQRTQAARTEANAFAELRKSGVVIHEVDRAPFERSVTRLWSEFMTDYPNTKPIVQLIRSTLL